jgi:hypothetical protein
MSNFIKFEEMYFLHTFWNFVGPCGLQEGIINGSFQYWNHYGFTTTYISQTTEGKFGSHRILHEVHQWIYVDYNTYGEIFEKGSEVQVEWGLLEGLGHHKVEISDHSDFDISKLEQEISCSCRCVIHIFGCSTISTRGRRHRSLNFFFK